MWHGICSFCEVREKGGQNVKSAIILISCALPVICQQQQTDSKNGTTPIFQVTVVERTVKAVNYQYRSEPTAIDFRGTVLLPKGKGEAFVQSKQGRTEIVVRFENLTEPERFGREYLTYVLWALTPDGRPHNIGEIVPGTSEKANLRVTTDMQAFAMIVTAEPYSAVRQPSDVVVLENQVRPDTTGKIEQVEAKYELLPRGLYSWQVPDQLESSASNARKVSMREYEALSELYQAQNAVGIARAASADRYAPNTLAKAQQLFDQAQHLEAAKADRSRVVEAAREAAETAEDARVIAEKRQQEEKIAQAQAEAAQARQAISQAEFEAQRARAEADAAQAQVDAERAARQRAEAEAAAARERAAHAEAQIRAAAPPAPSAQRPPEDISGKMALRMRVLEQLNGSLPTRDTPRGLVATISGSEFAGAVLRPSNSDQLGRIAALLAGQPRLRIEVEGHTDSADTAVLSQQRAEAVREILVGHGISSGNVSARGLGNSRPLASNSTSGGREENQRVEIIISGDAIGNIPFWDRSYALTSR
jgi:outer membrane protein OmpA-like peptidoglycan-associated protein